MKLSVLKAVVGLVLIAGCASKPTTPPEPSVVEYPYTKPLTSPGGKFGLLPLVVQNTVRSQAGATEIIDAVRDTSSGHVVYKIIFKNAPTLYVAPDGSVLYPDLTVAVTPLLGVAVKPANVPSHVMDVALDYAPHGEVAVIYKEHWGSRLVYIFTFKDAAKYPRLDVAEDGTVMDELE